MKFTKKIVSVGKYKGANGQEIDISPQRLKAISRTANTMLADGFRIPAPYAHKIKNDKGEEIPLSPVKVGTVEEGVLKTAKDNAGFWERFYVRNGALYGELEAERDEDITRIGKTVKETSIFVTPVFNDGHGASHKEATMHVALVTHPIEGKGQENFQPSDGIALSMSMGVDAQTDGPSASSPKGVGDLLRLLRDNVEIDLPADTTDLTLPERLTIALMQRTSSRKSGSLSKPPDGAAHQSAPILMSFTSKQIDAFLAAKTINPETNLPYTKEELEKAGTGEVDQTAYQQQVKANAILMAHLGNVGKGELQNRINALVASTRITKEYADAKLVPLLNDISMSFGDDGKIKPQPIHQLLEALEALPVPVNLGTKSKVSNIQELAMAIAMSHGHIQQPPDAMGEILSPAQIQAAADEVVKGLGGQL